MALLLVATQFVAAAAMVALALWLLWLNRHHAANQAFAAFLVLRATVIVCNQMSALAEGTPAEETWQHAAELALLAVVASIAIFVVAYVRVASDRWKLVSGIALSLALLEGLGIVVPCSLACQVGDLRWLGPLSLFSFGYPIMFALATLVLVVYAWRWPASPRRDATLLLAGALGLNAFLDASVVAARVGIYGFEASLAPFYPGLWRPVAFLLPFFAYLPLGIAFVVHIRRAGPRGQFGFFVLLVLTLGTAVFVGWSPSVFPALVGIGPSLLGLWRLALPAVAAYALLKHGLFDIDLRLKKTLYRGTVALSFLAVFFVVAQIMQNYLSQTLGFLVGGIAAGLLLFALQPVQKFAERFADVIMPNTRPIETLVPDQRRQIYHSQVSLAWADGVLDRSERRLLDDLRERLGLTHEEAALIEREDQDRPVR